MRGEDGKFDPISPDTQQWPSSRPPRLRRGHTHGASDGSQATRVRCTNSGAQWQNRAMLDFSPLAKALLTLSSAIAETATRPGDLLARDGCIQRFEYSYDLCVKSIRRQLEEMSDSPGELDALGYKDMLRMAVERGLIQDATPWFGFRELRNITSHAYNPEKAAKVYAGIPVFVREAQALVARLLP